MTEHDLQNDIRKALTKHGFAAFRMNVGAFYTKDGRFIPSSLPNGYSDITAFKNGSAYFIEVKVRPHKASPEQENFIRQMINRYDCRAGVAYSVEDALRICEMIP